MLVLCGAVAKTSMRRRAASRERLELIECLNKKLLARDCYAETMPGEAKANA
jgi:hypothetical protein